MPNAETQTDECLDVISCMNKELHAVQKRCEDAETLLGKFKAIPNEVATDLALQTFLGADKQYLNKDDWAEAMLRRLCDMCGLQRQYKRPRTSHDGSD